MSIIWVIALILLVLGFTDFFRRPLDLEFLSVGCMGGATLFIIQLFTNYFKNKRNNLKT